jgi:hypothetical protein
MRASKGKRKGKSQGKRKGREGEEEGEEEEEEEEGWLWLDGNSGYLIFNVDFNTSLAEAASGHNSPATRITYLRLH